MNKLCYYISGHGLGHASRSCQIINTLLRLQPSLRVEIVSDAPDWFFRNVLPPQVTVRYRRLDVGVIQRDSLQMDLPATLAAWQELLMRREKILEEESRYLREREVDLVVGDIPALAFAAARRAGVPSMAIGNFTWDWICAEMTKDCPGLGEVVPLLIEDYRQADLYLRLPFHVGVPPFEQVENLPLVARHSQRDRQEIRRELDLLPGQKMGLISFGGFGLKGYDFSKLIGLTDWAFFTESEQPWEGSGLRVLPGGRFYYPDLVAAADVVITKPGYGIVSEAIVHDTAVLYTSRGVFPEQQVLVDGLQRYARTLEIPNEDLRRGEWGDYLQRLLALPAARERLASDGDQVAAERLLGFLTTSKKA